MAIDLTGKQTSWKALLCRVFDSAYWGIDVSDRPAVPCALNNEYITAVNAAGTGTVNLLKADAANSVQIADGRMVVNSAAKTIVDGSATSLFDVAVTAALPTGGALFYNVFASDGTDFQSLTGMVTYASVVKSGVQTLTITEVSGNQAKAVSSGTLTLSWTYVTGTGKATVKLQPSGSLTETVFQIVYTVFPIRGAVTIL